MARSRWLVGSSRISRSQGVSRAAARAARFFWPPDRWRGLQAGSSIPRRSSIFRTRPSVSQYSSRSPVRSAILSSRLFPSSKTGSWGRQEIRSPDRVMTCPSSGSSVPATMERKVDLPVPLIPTTPIRSLSSIPIVTSVRMGLETKRLLTCSRFKIFICSLLPYGQSSVPGSVK